MSVNLYNILLVPFITILLIIFLQPTAITHKLRVSPLNSVNTIDIKQNLLISLFTTSVFISFVQCLFLFICFNGQVGTYQFLTQFLDTEG